MTWFYDVADGAIVALIFYALVRFRMKVAPLMRDWFGAWARWATWILVWVAMIAVANIGLNVLRAVLHEMGVVDPLPHEMLFALVAFVGGFYLVVRHVNRSRAESKKEKEP